MMAGRNLNVAGPPLRASQRRLGRARSRGRTPIAATPTPGAIARWRGRPGTVDRVDGVHAVVLLDDGKRWRVPIDELEPV